MSKNLKYFETAFENNLIFLRIHRSYIININFIIRITKNDGYFAVIDETTQLPIINDKVEEIIKLIGG